MHPDTEAFIHGLFGQCELSGQPMFLTLSAIHPTEAFPRPSRHIPLGNIKALKLAVDALTHANEAGWGAYIGVAPRRPGLGRWKRGSKTDLVALPALFIDIDDPPSNILDTLQNFVLPPSCIVSSGSGGYHAYWHITPSIAFSACEHAMRGLVQLFGGDPVSSAAHSMRIPGTLNTKKSRNTLCQLTFHDPDRRYPLSEFFKHLPDPDVKRNLGSFKPLCLPHTGEIFSKERIEAAKRNLLDAVIQRLDGARKSNGFWAALCPCRHTRDQRGVHFNYMESGTGICFGRHGRIDLIQMCKLLSISI